eukprot:7784827-Pyramimonas_sp.AAC.1
MVCIAAGGCWPEDRKFRKGLIAVNECPRCKLADRPPAPETPEHRHWLCPSSTSIFKLLSLTQISLCLRLLHKARSRHGSGIE